VSRLEGGDHELFVERDDELDNRVVKAVILRGACRLDEIEEALDERRVEHAQLGKAQLRRATGFIEHPDGERAQLGLNGNRETVPRAVIGFWVDIDKDMVHQHRKDGLPALVGAQECRVAPAVE
jgi:hypothetical protein